MNRLKWIVTAALACVLVCTLISIFGCTTATPARRRLEEAEAIYSEQGNQNDDKQFDAQEKALSISRNKTIDLELEKALNETRAKKAVMTSFDDVSEMSRLYALAEKRRQDFAKAQASFRALHEKNIATNRAGAAKARAALKSPKPEAPVDLGQQINSATGNTSPPPQLVE